MFDFLRDRGSTAEERQREALSAYLDNALPAAERERLEGQLARDTALRTELEQMRLLKAEMRAMPRRRVPRNFSLDPAVYGKPKAQPMMQLYPVLRGATALTAFLLIFTLALGAFRGGSFDSAAPESAAVSNEVAVEEQIESFDMAAATAGEEMQPMATAEMQLESAMEAPVEPAAPESAAGITELPADSLDMGETERAAEPTPAIEAAETATPEISVIEPPADVIAEEQGGVTADSSGTAAEPGGDTGESAITTLLGPIQIGLAVALLILLALWLIARRRVREYR